MYRNLYGVMVRLDDKRCFGDIIKELEEVEGVLSRIMREIDGAETRNRFRKQLQALRDE